MAFFETVLEKCIMTMAIAAVPVVELRGAIPAGIAAGLDPWLACGARHPRQPAAGAVHHPAGTAGVRPSAEASLFCPEDRRAGAPCPSEGPSGAEVPPAGTHAVRGHSPAGNRRMDRRTGSGVPEYPPSECPAGITLGVLIAGGLVTLMTMGVIRFL